MTTNAGIGYIGCTQKGLRDLVSQWIEPYRIPKSFRIITDTTEFIRIDYDDIVVLNNRPFLIRHNQKEGRFDDQVKSFEVFKEGSAASFSDTAGRFDLNAAQGRN